MFAPWSKDAKGWKRHSLSLARSRHLEAWKFPMAPMGFPSASHRLPLPSQVFSIVSTLGSLFWTLVLLLMLFYCFSVPWRNWRKVRQKGLATSCSQCLSLVSLQATALRVGRRISGQIRLRCCDRLAGSCFRTVGKSRTDGSRNRLHKQQGKRSTS